jgi:uncharacterized membrane protein
VLFHASFLILGVFQKKIASFIGNTGGIAAVFLIVEIVFYRPLFA